MMYGASDGPVFFTGELATQHAAVAFPVSIHRCGDEVWVLFPADFRRLAIAAGFVDRGYDVFDERTERVIERLVRLQYRAHQQRRWSLLGHRGCAREKALVRELDAELSRANAEVLGEEVA